MGNPANISHHWRPRQSMSLTSVRDKWSCRPALPCTSLTTVSIGLKRSSLQRDSCSGDYSADPLSAVCNKEGMLLVFLTLGWFQCAEWELQTFKAHAIQMVSIQHVARNWPLRWRFPFPLIKISTACTSWFWSSRNPNAFSSVRFLALNACFECSLYAGKTVNRSGLSALCGNWWSCSVCTHRCPKESSQRWVTKFKPTNLPRLSWCLDHSDIGWVIIATAPLFLN